ncbi:MAG: hypothetical protein H6727_04895 [Myxococcales bacterium]|nr:hypothetical protein [Myxococcales bacterium]
MSRLFLGQVCRRFLILFCLLSGAFPSCYLDPDVQCVADSDCRTRFLCQNSLCVCSAGLEQCGVDCVDLKSNANHCGACNNVCTGATPRCACPTDDKNCLLPASKPSCVAACPSGQTDCGTACVADFSTSKDHCGGCGKACRTDQVCSAGECKCEAPLVDCGGSCVDRTKDTDHCGGCNNKCAAGQACINGTCGTCPAERKCGDACPDLSNDVNHCGTCGNKCGQGEDCCDGKCVNLQTDTTYCGSCTTKCRSDQTCDANACKCMSGKVNCPAPVDACVDVLTDAKNCGQCGKSCPTESPVCIEGICCKTGENACAVGGGKVCADLNKDPENCGTCGTSCNGQICEGMACKKCTSDAQCGTGLTCDVGSGRCLCGSGCLWNKTLSGSKASVWVLGVAVSASQDVYVGGEFSGTMRTEDGNTYASQGAATNLFIARLDSAGKVKWIRTIPVAGATSNPENKHVRLAVGADEHLYVATTISGTKGTKVTVDSGLSQLNLSGGSDLFVGKLDNSGKWSWAISTGGEGEDYASGLGLDANNKVYVSGRFQKTVGFGTITLTANGANGSPITSGFSLYVAVLDPSSGSFVNVISPNGKASAEDIAVDSAGNAYITGQCEHETDFGGTKVSTNFTTSIYVAKLDSSLKFLWAEAGVGGGNGRAIALQPGVGVEVAGTFAGTIQVGGQTLQEPPKAQGQPVGTGFLVARFREANGRLDWVKTGHSLETQEVRDILLDASGVTKVAIYAKGDLIVDTQTLTASDKLDGFVVTLDSQGAPLSKQYTLIGPGDIVPTALAMDAAGSLYVVGYFGDSLNLSPSNPAIKIDPLGTIDSFFWKTP